MIGDIVLVNIGVQHEELRPAIVVREDDRGSWLHLFVAWKDLPLAAGVGAYTSTMGLLIEGAREGTDTGQYRKRGEDDAELLDRL